MQDHSRPGLLVGLQLPLAGIGTLLLLTARQSPLHIVPVTARPVAFTWDEIAGCAAAQCKGAPRCRYFVPTNST